MRPAAHLADPLVMPVAQPPHRLCREAPRLAAVQQDRQDAARVHLSLEPLGDVGGAVDLAAHRAKRLGRRRDPRLDVVVVRQVVGEERAEVHERLREADGAAAVEHEVRGVTVSVRRSARRAVQGLRLAPLAVRPHVHEEAEEPKVVIGSGLNVAADGVRHGDQAHGAAAPVMKGIAVRSLAKSFSRRNHISQPQRRIVIRAGASNETDRRR